MANTSQEEHDKKYAQTVERLKPYGNRSHIVRAMSSEAAPSFADGSLDFVYIDANHSYEGCRDDIALWWPKVKVGGILAGHDYVDGAFPEGEFGVKQAVDAFAAGAHQRVFVVPVLWPTWYVIKS
jgi:predicted O-methyltransferase YrrM